MIDIPSHSSIEDRIDLARRMKEEMEIDSKVEMLVDNMEDHFNKDFAAWPIRYFIAKEGQLLHKSENRIDNALFDQDTIQNFFKGLRPKTMKLISDSDFGMITMLHFSSLGNLPDHQQPLLRRNLKIQQTTEDVLRSRSIELIDVSNELDKQLRSLPEPLMVTMLHFSSIGNFPDHPSTLWERNFSRRRRRLKIGLCASLLCALLLPFYLYCL